MAFTEVYPRISSEQGIRVAYFGNQCLRDFSGLYSKRLEYEAFTNYRCADKSLARPGRKQAAPVKSVMGRGIVWFD